MEKTNMQRGIAPIIILLIVVGLVGVGGGVVYVKNKNKAVTAESPSPTPLVNEPTVTPTPENMMEEGMMNDSSTVKEFSMNSWYEMKDGKPATFFSLSEIKVKKGDTVRIKVTNTKGSHDFSLDEYGIKKATPLNQEVVIEFKADKAGSFKYYCSMPGHRMMGQEGTLIVE